MLFISTRVVSLKFLIAHKSSNLVVEGFLYNYVANWCLILCGVDMFGVIDVCQFILGLICLYPL